MDIKTLLGDKLKEDMTAEELLALDIEMPEDKSALLKKRLDEATAEASKFKKELNARKTAEEKAKDEAEERFNQMQNELEQLKLEKAITETANDYVSLGYSTENATKISNALHTKDFKTVCELQKEFIEQKTASAIADYVKGFEKPTSDNSTSTLSKEDFSKMGYQDKVKLFNENPTLYKELNER